jgi:sugar (pentulose or hexulose) kinase
MTMYNYVNAMNDSLGEKPDHLIVTGGGAKSDVLMQMFADLFAIPVIRPLITDAAGLGAAISACVAVGMHNSIESAQRQMIKRDRIFEPNIDATVKYRQLNQVFREATSHTDKILYDLYAVSQSK